MKRFPGFLLGGSKRSIALRLILALLALLFLTGCTLAGRAPRRAADRMVRAIVSHEKMSQFYVKEYAKHAAEGESKSTSYLFLQKRTPTQKAVDRFYKKYTKVRFRSVKVQGDTATVSVMSYPPNLLDFKWQYEGEDNEDAIYRYYMRNRSRVKYGPESLDFIFILRREDGQWKLVPDESPEREDEKEPTQEEKALNEIRIKDYEQNISVSHEKSRRNWLSGTMEAAFSIENNGDKTVKALTIGIWGMNEDLSRRFFEEELKISKPILPKETATVKLSLDHLYLGWDGSYFDFIRWIEFAD